MQGKHFVHSLGKHIFADEENSRLDEMYAHTTNPQKISSFILKVWCCH